MTKKTKIKIVQTLPPEIEFRFQIGQAVWFRVERNGKTFEARQGYIEHRHLKFESYESISESNFIAKVTYLIGGYLLEESYLAETLPELAEAFIND